MSELFEQDTPDELDPSWEYANTIEGLRETLLRDFGHAALFADPHTISAAWIGRVVPRIIDGKTEFQNTTMKIFTETDNDIGIMACRVVLREGKDYTTIRNYWLHDNAVEPDDLNQDTANDDEWVRTALSSGVEFSAKQAQRLGNRHLKRRESVRRRQLGDAA